MWNKHNENPAGRQVGDCTVRAIAAATGEGWEQTHLGLCMLSHLMYNMPSADEVWGEYLHKKGWKRRFVSENCSVCYTVEDFCREYPQGTYVLGLQGHVLTVIDGRYFDTWDSGEGHPIYYWTKEEVK